MAGFMDSLGASLKGLAKNIAEGQNALMKGAYDVATAAFDSKDVSDTWGDFAGTYQKNFFEGLGHGGEAMSTLINSNKYTKGAVEGMETAYHETVGRGITTLNLAHNMADEDNQSFLPFSPVLPIVGGLSSGQEFKTMFDADTWRKAYNMSDTISPGQSAVGFAEGMSVDQIEQSRLDGDFNEGRLKWESGAADFTARLADPSNLAGKAVSVTRLKYIKPITNTKDAAKYVETNRFAKVADVVTKAKSRDEIRLRLLNSNQDGALVSEVLWNTRHDPELLRIGVRAMYGDKSALDDLTRYNEVLAQTGSPVLADGVEAAAILGRHQAGQTRRTILNRVGTDLEEPGDWETYTATLKADEQLFDQLTVLKPELLAEVSSRKPLASTNAAIPTPAMRDSVSSRLRFSVHQSSFYGAPVIVSSGFKKLLGSNRRIHGIDFDDGNSDQAVRTYLERAGLPEQQKVQLMDQYIAASANKSAKQSVMVRAEQAVITHMGKMYGFDEDEINEIITKAAQNSGRARMMLANKHEFASEDIQKQMIDEGAVTTWTDEAGNIHAATTPQLESQLQDIYPVADPGQLHSVMKDAVSRDAGGVRHRLTAVTGTIGNSLDAIHKLWKPMVLVGLGYPVRALSDEGSRQIGLYGIRDVAMSTGKGFTNSVANHAEMGANKFSILWQDRNRQRIKALTANTLDPQVPATNRWVDIAEAYTSGAISKSDFAAMTTAANKAGMGDMFEAARFADADLGILTKGEFERTVVHKALQRDGKSWFIQPTNQRDLIKQVDADRIVDINPLTGEGWQQGKGVVETGKPLVIPADPVAGHAYSNSKIYDFVYDNSDALMKPGAGMRIMKRDDGALELRSYAPKRTIADRRLDVKRMEREFVKTARTAGNKPVRFEPTKGVVWEFEAATAGAGESMSKKISSDSVHANYMLEQHGLAADRIHASSGWSPAINHDSADYPAAWQRAALQLTNDPAARQFLEFGDYNMVKDWATRSPEGKRWAREMSAFGDIDSRLQGVELMVNSYAPDVADLQKKILDGVATYDDLVKAIPDASQRPQVHGEVLDYNLGAKGAMEFVRKGINKTMEKISTIPSDKLSRYPFFAKSYRNHIEGLAKIEFENMGDAHMISVDRKFELEQAARKRAMGDVKKWLYNSDMTSDAVESMRHFAPFAAAWQDGMRAWGRLAFQKPQTMANIYQIWQSPERAGLIVDADGRQLSMEGGKEVWYAEDPETGARTRVEASEDTSRYVQFQLPSWMTPDEFGPDTKVPVRINKDSFNTFMHLDPGAGPVVAIAASEFAKRNPEMSENALMKRVLPYGPTDNSLKNAMSNEARGLFEVWKGEDDSVYRNQAMMILQAETVKYNTGERVTKPSFDEALDKASDLKLMRTVLTSVLPVSPQFMSPYQAHIDAYHQLSASDPMTADEKFYELYGDDFFVLTARVTKGVKGLPPTMEGYKQLKKYKDLVGEYPEIAGAIIGSTGGAFNKSVYEYQKANRIKRGSTDPYRELMSLEESLEDVETREGWIKFQSMQDTLHADLSERGLTDVNDTGAEDLKEKRDALIELIGFKEDGSPTSWYEAYSTREPSKMMNKLAGLRVLATDERMLGRADIEGLADYLAMRDDFKSELKLRTDAGMSKTLDAKSNSDIRDMWNRAVFDLKDRNLAFSSLYDRYLTQDDLEV